MNRLHEDLWVTEAPLRFFGLEVGARMTVVRLPGSKLLLHSPISATPELVQEVKALGSVAHLVAPNLFHHLYVAEWKREFPDAAIHVAPGLDAKRADLEVTGILTNTADAGWQGALDQVVVEGFPLVNEVVFFHPASATLIATDLAFNVGPGSPWLTRVAIRLSGTYGRLGPTLLERFFVRDRPAFRTALERILDWPFERVIVAHGEISEWGGREELIQGYAWLLGRGTS